MKFLNRIVCCFILLLVSVCFGQDYFPDLPDYQTLICDFHTHTVFSDGRVWPTVRVDEAAREGLDVLAISDHIEHQPHKADIPTQHHRPYEIAAGKAKEKNILLIKAAEITRDTPPGHYNALFLDDIKRVDTPKFLDAIHEANKQKAFVFWNHHAWKGEQRGQWEEVQDTMYEKKWLHGMEVANGTGYYPSAHRWCLEKNLTMLGNSDIHSPASDDPYTAQKHRTVTLVFAKQRTIESVAEALRAGQTAVWLENQLIGRREYLQPLFEQCVTVEKPHYRKDTTVYFEMNNHALIDIQLERSGKVGPAAITIPARSSVIVKSKVPTDATRVQLSYVVKNFLIEPDKGLPVEFSISGLSQ